MKQGDKEVLIEDVNLMNREAEQELNKNISHSLENFKGQMMNQKNLKQLQHTLDNEMNKIIQKYGLPPGFKRFEVDSNQNTVSVKGIVVEKEYSHLWSKP